MCLILSDIFILFRGIFEKHPEFRSYSPLILDRWTKMLTIYIIRIHNCKHILRLIKYKLSTSPVSHTFGNYLHSYTFSMKLLIAIVFFTSFCSSFTAALSLQGRKDKNNLNRDPKTQVEEYINTKPLIPLPNPTNFFLDCMKSKKKICEIMENCNPHSKFEMDDAYFFCMNHLNRVFGKSSWLR